MKFNTKFGRTPEKDVASATFQKSMGLTIHGTDRDETINGDWYSGDDEFYGGGGSDTLNGFAGDDELDGGAGDDIINGGDGNDDIDGGEGNDVIWAGEGNDFVLDQSGTDVVFLEGGDDWFYSGVGNTDTNSIVFGGTGNDTIHSPDGTLFADGGAGNDTIYASGRGQLTAFGGAGNDRISGGSNDDYLYGGDGDDYILGGRGDDIIDMGGGSNSSYGGRGSDTFVLTESSSGVVNGGSFTSDARSEKEYDTLDLSNLSTCDVSEIVENGDGSGYIVFADGQVLNFEHIDEIIPPTPHDGDNGFNDSPHDDIDCIDTDLDGAKVDDTGQVGLDLWKALTAGQAVLSEQMPIETDAEEEDIEQETWF